MKIKVKNVWIYALSILIPLAVGGLTSGIISNDTGIYITLIKPPISPPDWIFPVVWTILYVIMGISAARVYMSCSSGKSDALFIYGVQLFINLLWPVFFFKFQAWLVAFFWIIFLLLLVVLMLSRFKSADEKAARLLIPYLIWLIFAAYLNIGVYILNR